LRLNYTLADAFLAENGDSAWLRGRRLERGRDYRLERTEGELHVLCPFQAGDTLHLTYRTLPLELATMYGRRPSWQKPQVSPVPAPVVVTAAAPPSSAPLAVNAAATLDPGATPTTARVPPAAGPSKPELKVSGNKSVVVEAGNRRDPNLQQSFDLSATGKLGGGVNLVALLSDRDTPLTESGATVDLQELDKILVEVQSPIGTATLGDYTLNQRMGQFGVYEREFTGARVLGQVSGFSGQAAIAESKGRFRSINFPGDEGRQGPYFLTDEAGNAPISVVAGSDMVWLDGVKMTRGESADYSIDYLRGTITFSPRQIISSASRISLDYQVANAAYKRTATQLSGGLRKGRLELFGHAYRESDDAGNPTALVLDPDDLDAIAGAGDDPRRALGSGIHERPGDYVRLVDGSGVTFYSYVGGDSGSFDLEFVDLGSGRGSYAESTVVLGRAAFRYTGPGLGTHVPGRVLALPQQHALYGGGGSLEIIDGVKLDGELAASRFDLNRLSGVGDGDDQGLAARVGFLAQPRLKFGRTNLGRLELQAGLRRQDVQFVPLARVDYPLYQEDWGVNADRRLPGRDVRHVAAAYHPVSRLSFSGERAWLTSADGYRADRWQGTAELTGRLSHRLRLDRVDSRDDSVSVNLRATGYRNKLLYAGEWSASPILVPHFDLDYEDRVPPGAPAQAIRYRAWETGLRGSKGVFSWSGGYQFRRDFSLATSFWALKQTARTLRLESKANLSKSLALTLGASRRRTEFVSGAEMRSDNGFARLRQGGRSGRFRQDASFEWMAEALPRRLREVVFVGEGAGLYDSLGNFRSGGNFDLRLSENPDSLDHLTRAVFSYRALWQPGRSASGAPTGSWWRDLRSTSTLQSSSSTKGSLHAGDLLSLPSRIETDPRVVLGTFLFRQEFQHVTQRPFEVYLRLEYGLAADRRVANYSQAQESWSEEARLRWRRGRRWLWELRGRANQSVADVTMIGGIFQGRSLDAVDLTWETTYIPSERVRLVGRAQLERITGTTGEFSQIGRIGPQAIYTIGNRFRADGQLRWSPWIEGRSVPTLLPTALAIGPDRFDFRLDLSYRLQELANVSVGWTGRERQGGSLVHTARGELRAYF
jgi:hypothetical protein